MEDLEFEMKKLIVEALMLDHVKAEEIDTDGALFGDGLGLDSVDALELAMAIERRFGVRIKAKDEGTREVFRSVRTLAEHVRRERAPS